MIVSEQSVALPRVSPLLPGPAAQHGQDRKERADQLKKVDLVLTSYALVRRDAADLAQVGKLITRGTVEEKILALQQRKKDLAAGMLEPDASVEKLLTGRGPACAPVNSSSSSRSASDAGVRARPWLRRSTKASSCSAARIVFRVCTRSLLAGPRTPASVVADRKTRPSVQTWPAW